MAVHDVLSMALSRGGRLFPHFDYSSDQWTKIEKEIVRLDPAYEVREEPRATLCTAASTYFRELANKQRIPEIQHERKQKIRRWQRAERLTEALISEFRFFEWEERGNLPPGYKAYDEELIALLKVKLTVHGILDHLNRKLDPAFPRCTPKDAFRFSVLQTWTKLGGKLRFSRHPISGSMTGPLVRFFSAVTEPVYSGSPESLPAILRRYEAYETARTKWRAATASSNNVA